MTESDELYAEIRVIRSRIEGIEHTQEILVRAQANQIVTPILELFARDRTLANVYLLVDGQRSQQEIVLELKARGHEGASDATVSRKIESLHRDLALVDLVDQNQRGKIYRRSAVDRILQIARKVEKLVKDT